jgi:hypothetical protein
MKSAFKSWAPVVFEKYTSRISKNDIIFTHTYRNSKGTVEILEKNMLYFELQKKQISTKFIPIHNHKFVVFYSSKYNAISGIWNEKMKKMSRFYAIQT